VSCKATSKDLNAGTFKVVGGLATTIDRHQDRFAWSPYLEPLAARPADVCGDKMEFPPELV